ncbi:tetratricopeptide repeat-containing sensor histidine kinase [Flavobacterium sp. N1994]|uniref:tetratricopeptide repeat-containing sensor histidine kinase n=1 Tax=Flavobacterium sp. N1994 TaxID=2986827 RepID=UPI0022234E73|nr:tetratricopeptide repeat-containing sensor histidine kinase [Flavobacterium sp. N1994]
MKFSTLLLSCLIIFSCSKNKSANTINSKKINAKTYFETYKRNLNSGKNNNDIYLIKALSSLKSEENNLNNRNLLSDIVFEFYKNGDKIKLDQSSKLLLDLSISGHDTLNLGMAYRSRGNFYFKIQKLDSSYYFCIKAEKIYAKLKDRKNYANILMNKGIVQYSIGDYLGAEYSLKKAHSIFKDTNVYNRIYGSLDQLGLVSTELKEYEKGIFYFKEALEAIKDLPSKEDREYYTTVCQNNIGYLYLKSREFEKGAYYFEEALKNKLIKNDDPLLYSNLIDNLAYCKLFINKLANTDLSPLFFEALEIRKNLNNPTAVVGSYIHISEYFNKRGDSNQAIKYSLLSLSVAKESKVPLNVVLALKQSSIVDKKKAFQYTDEYIRINDSLQIAERKSRDRFNRMQLETDEIISENKGLAERNRKLLYFFVISVIIGILLFVVRAQRARTRELLYKQAQQKANEDIYNLMMSQQSIIDESRSKEKKRLAQDLHDGILGRMFGLRLNLDSLNSSTEEDAVQKRHELLNELKTIEQDIREISHDLNREKLVLINNFVSIVHNLLEEQKSMHDANVNYNIDDTINWDKIGNAIKINLYRILQEGLQNINKYANAKNINVEIKGDDENVYLKIKDDGIGFDVNKKSKGIGMQNMISRTKECQGIIDINSKKDNGTKIVITIPIQTKQITEQEA